MKAHVCIVLVSVVVSVVCFFALPSYASEPGNLSIPPSKINLNKADLNMLVKSYKGIGKKRAEAIIAWRQVHHGFKSINELANVKGFSKKFIRKNNQQLEDIFYIDE